MNSFGHKSDVQKHLSRKAKKLITPASPMPGIPNSPEDNGAKPPSGSESPTSVAWSREKLIDRRLP